MVKKKMVVMVIWGLMIGVCFADLTDQLQQAMQYQIADNISEAEAIYMEIITGNSSSDAVAKAKIGLARMRKRQARLHGETARYSEAETLYKEVLAGNPSIENAIMAQRHLTVLYISKGDETKAQASLNKLKTTYPDCTELHKAVYHIARRYEFHKKYEKAVNIYQYVIDNFPASERAVMAQFDLRRVDVLTLMDSGNDSEANTAIDKLITDYANYNDMPMAVIQIGECYEKKGATAKAIVIWEKVIGQLPNSDMAAMANNLAGESCRQSGDYGKSVEYYQRIADNYPESELAGHALFMVGRNYEQMGESGVISKSEADAEIKTAYQKLVRDYPNCKAAKAANRWLEKNDSK